MQKANTPLAFGALFQKEREALGLTQDQVAKQVGCRRQTIGQLEAGGNVKIRTVFKALAAIRKCVQLAANRPELEDVAGLLDE